MSRKLLSAFLILVLAASSVGCAMNKGHLDPRRTGDYSVNIKDENTKLSVLQDGPAPFFVEPNHEVSYQKDGDKVDIKVVYNTKAKEASSFWSNAISGVLGFVTGIVTSK